MFRAQKLAQKHYNICNTVVASELEEFSNNILLK